MLQFSSSPRRQFEQARHGGDAMEGVEFLPQFINSSIGDSSEGVIINFYNNFHDKLSSRAGEKSNGELNALKNNSMALN